MALQKKVGIYSVIRKLLILALCWSLSSTTLGETLRIGALNAEWLWTPNDGNVDGSRFNKGDPSRQEYMAELSYYRSLIFQSRLDIVALSEIENEQVAKEFASHLGAEWQYYFKQGRDTATGQDVAFLSRIGSFVKATDYGFPAGTVRGYKPKRLSKVLGISFVYHGQPITLITSHFLSKRKDTAKKAAKRLMQARALVNAARSDSNVKDGGHLIVLGDFNDRRASQVIKTLESELALSNAQVACKNVQTAKKLGKLIDHILFRGFECKAFRMIEIQEFSDHPLIITELSLQL